MSEIVQPEIDKYINTQTALFDAIAKSDDQVITPGQIEYVPPITAENITTLNTNRAAQEAFIKQYQEQYEFITSLRQKYTNDLAETNTILAEQTSELSELEKSKKIQQNGASTEFRRLKIQKYNQAKQEFYYHLYLICGIIQFVILAVLIFAKLGFIPRATAIILFLLVVIGLGLYIIYYLFFSTRARDIIVFDRFKFPVDNSRLLACPSNKDAKKASNKNAELDAKIAGILTDTSGQCPNILVPDAKMPELPTTTTTPNPTS
jgi:heme/copper-type cytochrome/quinol oxidase subunit 4